MDIFSIFAYDIVLWCAYICSGRGEKYMKLFWRCFVICVLEIFLLSGCGINKSDELIYTKSPISEITMPGYNEDMAYVDGSLYILQNIENSMEMYVYDVRDNVRKIQELKIPISDAIISLAVMDNNHIYILSEKADEQSCILWAFDEKGNTLSSLVLQTEYQDFIEGYDEDNLHMTVSKDYVVLNCLNRLLILDAQLNLVREETAQWEIESVSKTKEQKLVCMYNALADDGKKVRFQYYDLQNMKFEKAFTTSLARTDGLTVLDGTLADFYVKNRKGLWECNEFEIEKTFLYEETYETAQNYTKLISEEDGSFICYDASIDQVSRVEKVNRSEALERTKIVLGAVGIDEEGGFYHTINEFNRKSKIYYIEIKDYLPDDVDLFSCSSQEYEQAEKELQMDVLHNDACDLIYIQSEPYKEWITKGLFEDLSPYFQQDEDISEDDLLDNIVESLKVDGKLYYIMPEFVMDAVACKRSLVGEKKQISIEEMQQLLTNNDTSLDGFFDFYGLFITHYLNNGGSFAQEKKDVSQEELSMILKMHSRIGASESTQRDVEKYRSNQLLFMPMYEVGIDSIMEASQIFKEEIAIIGYPGAENGGTYFVPRNPVAMMHNAKNKDGAWEFICYLLSAEYQNEVTNEIPVLKSAFDLYVKRYTITEVEEIENHQVLVPIGMKLNGEGVLVEDPNSVFFNPYLQCDFQRHPLSDAEMDLFLRLIDETHEISYQDHELINIYIEEASAYFEGDKSIEETAKVMYGRAKIRSEE